jgi:1-deoxy-D-xylulose-5-phosphate synthase
MLSNIPNFVYMEPANESDFRKMFEFSKNYFNGPTAIRVGFGVDTSALGDIAGKSKVELNKSEVVFGSVENADVLILGLGQYLERAIETAKVLNKKGVEACVINPRFITGLDTQLLEKFGGKIIATFESGQLSGGFGEHVAGKFGALEQRVINFGAHKEFTNNIPLQELEERYNLTPELAANKILKHF